MRFETNAYEGQETLPTFVQWCKANKDEKTAQRYFVTKVWRPNKFPDLTLETEAFRVRVSHKSSVFNALVGALEELRQSEQCIAITEIDKIDLDFTIEVVENERCTWEDLGDYGHTLKVQDKPSRKSRRTEKPLA